MTVAIVTATVAAFALLVLHRHDVFRRRPAGGSPGAGRHRATCPDCEQSASRLPGASPAVRHRTGCPRLRTEQTDLERRVNRAAVLALVRPDRGRPISRHGHEGIRYDIGGVR